MLYRFYRGRLRPPVPAVLPDRRARRAGRWLGALALLGLIPGTSALADGTVFDATRVLSYRQAECAGQPARQCHTYRTRLTRVGPAEAQRVSLRCPARQPHLVGWDTKRHEHLEITLAPTPVAAAAPRADGEPDGITVIVSNRSDRAGSFRLYVGCANKPFDGSGGMMRTAHASPSRPVLQQATRR